MLNSLQI